MLKHIGRHGDRKVAIVFRQIPGEDHMCLVIYPDVLPTHIHNAVMNVLESAPGQQATVLADVFHRNLLPDGRVILEALHREGMLKKVATNQVIVTPTATSNVKLDELNRLVKEMESGTEALKRMQEIDKSSGMVAPEVKRQAEANFKNNRQSVTPLRAPENGALDDKAIAGSMLQQAKQMELDAKSMIAEAARMKKDAARMFPSATTSDAKKVTTVESAPKARTRKKAVTADVVQ
jgi:hypothetical protein